MGHDEGTQQVAALPVALKVLGMVGVGAVGVVAVVLLVTAFTGGEPLDWSWFPTGR